MFNKRIKIKELLLSEPQGQQVTVMGWVRTFRNNQFIALNDGSTNNNLQVVAGLGKFDEELLKRITTSASLKVTGTIVPSLGKGSKKEKGSRDPFAHWSVCLVNYFFNIVMTQTLFVEPRQIFKKRATFV